MTLPRQRASGAAYDPHVRVALTFDTEHNDRPHTNPRDVDDVLDALEEIGATATFFVQGRWALANPDPLARIVRDGHLVASHSHYHCWTPMLTDKGIARDLADARRAIQDVAGVDPLPWFRLPFFGGADNPRVVDAVTTAGYELCGANVAPFDWDPAAELDALCADAQQGIGAHDPAVVVLHSWPRHTADLIRSIGRDFGAGASYVRFDALTPEERAALNPPLRLAQKRFSVQ
jgi:peptidoglycan/xylan/chitin deacetylase (PgdA/CDA1 family)